MQRVSDGITGDVSGALCVQGTGTLGQGKLFSPATLLVEDVLMDLTVKNSGSA